ncbi:MAG: DNA gyrase C-terminal beta-propeller domain-containing protein, partial [Bacteroidota bacterium]
RYLSIREILQHYIEHRIDVVTRRTQYEEKKAKARYHILQGLLIAQDNLDKVVALIRNSANTEAARLGLMNDFSLTEIQANAILELQLRRLTALERGKLEDEAEYLRKLLEELAAILADRGKVLGIIKTELKEIKDRYGDERKTRLEVNPGELTQEDLIPEEQMAVFMTDQGYIKRLSLDTFEKQRRGGRGVGGMGTREGDFVRHFFVGSTHSQVLFFTNKGLAYSLKVYNLPEAGRQAKGTNVMNLLPLSQDEMVTAVIPIDEFEEGHFLTMLTKKGTIKRTDLKAFSAIRKSGIIALALDDEDELGWVCRTNGHQTIIIGTAEGMAIHFPEEELRPLGRTARGVRAITLREEDMVIGMAIGTAGDVLSVTTDGYGKRTNLTDYRLQGRGGLGLINMKLNANRNGKVANILIVNDSEEVVIVTTNAIVIRQKVESIPRLGRMTQGCRLQRMDENDRVAAVALVVADEMEDEE